MTKSKIAVSFATGLLCVMTLPRVSLGAVFFHFDGVGNIVSNPSQYASWDKTEITYQFDPSFRNAFPGLLLDQARLAFDEWGEAFHAPAVPSGGGFLTSLRKFGNTKKFADLRTLVLHELGHVLGYMHPKFAEFSPPSRNFRSVGGTIQVVAPNAKEVMRAEGFVNEYNHFLSEDEIFAFKYVYSQDIQFREVTAPQPADIVLTMSYLANTMQWGKAEIDTVFRNPSDQTQGQRITAGRIKINSKTAYPIGMKPKAINWDYKNSTGKNILGMRIRTSGTNNIPLQHWDNDQHAMFNTYVPSLIAVGHDFRDHLLHTWTDTSLRIAQSDDLHVGLLLDTTDWNVVSAEALHLSGQTTKIPLMVASKFTAISAGFPARGSSPSLGGELPATFGPMALPNVASGIRIQNSDFAAEIGYLGVGIVDGLDLTLEDLNRDTMGDLINADTFAFFPKVGIVPLGPSQDCVFLFDGQECDLPEQLLADGNYLMLDRPELVNHELFLFFESRSDGGSVVGNYALFDNPIVAIPEPSGIVLVTLACLWGAPRRTRTPAPR